MTNIFTDNLGYSLCMMYLQGLYPFSDPRKGRFTAYTSPLEIKYGGTWFETIYEKKDSNE